MSMQSRWLAKINKNPFSYPNLSKSTVHLLWEQLNWSLRALLNVMIFIGVNGSIKNL